MPHIPSEQISPHAFSPPESPLAYRPKQLARVLGIGYTSIFKAIKEGRLPARKFGAATLVMHEDAMAFLKGLPLTDGAE
jgi:excisionase family DNA binding protein